MENLEGRSLPAIGFLAGFGVGVTGQNAAIHANAVATDAVGDTFVTGSFRGTITLDPSTSTGTYTATTTQDTFVAKYGPTGALIWSTRFAGQVTSLPGGGTSNAVSQGSAIAVDAAGDVFVAGGFGGQVNLPGASSTLTINGPVATTQVYLARLGPSGSVAWVDAVVGTTYDVDQAYALALDGSGGVVIAGSFQDSATFGSTTLTAGGPTDAFVARTDGNGAFSWAIATQGGSGSNAEIHGLAIDGSGNIDLAGFFSGSVDFDPGSSTTTLTSLGSDDAVAWKLDPGGHFLWARSYGSADYDAASAIAVDASGDLLVTGTFSDSVTFGPLAHPDTLIAGPIFDTFVLKLDPIGNEVWAKGLVGPGGYSKGQGIAVDPSGEIDLAGTFSGLVDFDPNSGTDNLTSVGSSDIFVVGLTPGGNLVYALQAGQSNFNAALGIAVNASGTASIAGTYSNAIAFGSTSVAANGTASVFVARASTQPPIPAAPSSPVLEAASDTGPSQADGITSVTSPIFDVNTAVATDPVELLRNGVVVAMRTGPGPLTDPGPLADGTYSYTAIQANVMGVFSPSGASTPVTILTTPPPAPSSPVLASADDSGTIGDRITNVRQPHLSVVARAGTTIQLLVAGQVIGSAFAANAGTYPIAPSQPLLDGTYQVAARAIDLAGNIGTLSSALSLTILTKAPASPSVPALSAADVTGPSGSNLTSVRQPRITGTAPSGTTIEVFNVVTNGIIATAPSNGSYTASVTSPLADGSYYIDVVTVDVAGNISQPGPPLTFTIDTTPPVAPSAPTLFGGDDSGTPGDGITNVRQPRLTGSAEAGSTVALVNGSGAVVGSSVAASDGTFAIKPTSAMADGTYTLKARATDPAGNVGPLGPSMTITIDTTPPVAPSVLTLFVGDDSGTIGDGITNVRQPRLTGTAEPGSTVAAVDGSGNVDGSTVAASDGTFTIKPSSSLPDGTYTLQARATDPAGNVGPLGQATSLRILATPPTAPGAISIYAADDSGGPNLTNVRQPRLSGTAPANDLVQIIGPGGILEATATASPAGTYLARLSSPLADGTYALKAVATDVAGNISVPGPSFSLTILATPPVAPSTPTLLSTDDSGTVGDNITNVRQPHLTSKAPAGLKVELLNASGAILGTATASATGSVTIAPTTPLVDGTYPLRLVDVDAAGNVSVATSAISLTILTATPTTPAAPALLTADDSGPLLDGMTEVLRPRVVGTATPGDRVDWIASNGAVYVSTTAASNGSYQLQPPTALINGVYPVRVRQTDLAGNIGATSQPFTLIIRAQTGDYFGDGKTDVGVFQSNPEQFIFQRPNGQYLVIPYGSPGDIPIHGDFFGNGHEDLAFYRPSTSTFYIYDLITNASKTVQFGQSGDIPVPADYDGDGKADIAVYRPSNGAWFVLNSTTNALSIKQFGIPGDIPVPADYFGDGHASYAVYRPSNSTFYATDPIAGNYQYVPIGVPGDTPVPADYEGIGWADFAVFQPSNDLWTIQSKTTGAIIYRYNANGIAGDTPVLGDYFGDGRNDLTVYRKSTSTFYEFNDITGAVQVVQIGTPGLVKPLQGPITIWFGADGSANTHAIAIVTGGSGSALIPDMVETNPAPSTVIGTTRTRKLTAIDQAIEALGLERWRI